MNNMSKPLGQNMAKETAEAPAAFVKAVLQKVSVPEGLRRARGIYTVARGSSDAVANILSYEFMARLGIPVTSLPPSVFSIGDGVRMDDNAALIISQSGGSDDLVLSAWGIRKRGGTVAAITNVEGSPVESEADTTIPVGAGPEVAVPATKTVIASIGAGMALLAALNPDYRAMCEASANGFEALEGARHPRASEMSAALLRSQHVYVVGRGTGYGAAHEVALKLKETCALHAEAYSASEVLHGPLQLTTRPLLVLMLDIETEDVQPSLDLAEQRFRDAGSTVIRLRPSEMCGTPLPAPAAAAALLHALYPVIHAVALSLGFDPDVPDKLAKVTRTT